MSQDDNSSTLTRTEPLDPPVDSLIHPDCQEQMRQRIDASNGAEVFFIGRLNDRMQVTEVDYYAVGNQAAVPALIHHVRPGEVAIHNHPSGQLEPSNADIGVSSELGSRGAGSWIINNEVTEVRIVVRVFTPPKRRRIDAEKLTNWLKPGGRVAERMDAYENRPEQIEMLKAVARAFNEDGVAVIEAGTGTGKSMAYLLPALAWAVRNEERVVISTGTINLQEQILEKDLPLLQNISDIRFSAALLKGRGNYLSRRRAEYIRSHPNFLDMGEKQEQLDQIQTWTGPTGTGSLEDLGFSPDPDVWEKGMSEADNCLRARCPTYQQCFFYNARRRAARAQILIVNHHLLLADLAVRAQTDNYKHTAVLPPYSRIIIDEAHNLEEAATGHFGLRFSRNEFFFTMRRMRHTRTGAGLLDFLTTGVQEDKYSLSPAKKDELLRKLALELPERHARLRHLVDEAAEMLSEALESETSTPLQEPLELKKRITSEIQNSPLWEDKVVIPLRKVLAASRDYLEGLYSVVRQLGFLLEDNDSEIASPILEFRSVTHKIDQITQKLIRFMGSSEDHCRWIEYRRRPNGRQAFLSYCSAPIDISEHIRDQILRRFKSVVLTSATLTVEQKFGYFLRQIGASDPLQLGIIGYTDPDSPVGIPEPGDIEDPDPISPKDPPVQDELGKPLSATNLEESPDPKPIARVLTTLRLETSFNYNRQVYVGIPMDLPEPTDQSFEGQLTPFLADSLDLSRGRAFILFTAYSRLNRVFDHLAPLLEKKGYPCLKQGQASRSMLTEAFRRDIGSVLFATSSFWEGVDVQGESLSCLAITRLPFRVPGEPLAEARIEALSKQGLDPFYNLIVPQAVIRFRQGFGRLIRSKTDRGAILICDRRVATKRYGRMFLNSLPSSEFHQAPTRNILEVLEAFYTSADRQPEPEPVT